ncbi:Unknown protein sequence [Pseudomonas savastanoi pv. glycinea]|uniref:Uncharacterized protein n=1 Tax=Pseudomonas savastanoi pv. glycinea TaxID=318 RepID=A0ABR5L2X5_PSESG|nr:Unknown protein sequence [Pseudomonas savastanoi pv. glycinea]
MSDLPTDIAPVQACTQYLQDGIDAEQPLGGFIEFITSFHVLSRSFSNIAHGFTSRAFSGLRVRPTSS